MWNEDHISLIDITDSVEQALRRVDWNMPGEKAYEIRCLGAPVGHVFVSEGVDEDTILIEWIEIFDAFRGMHLLKPSLEKLASALSKKKILLDASMDLVPKYLNIGASITSDGYDVCREMVSMEYVAGCDSTKKEERHEFTIVYSDAAVDLDSIFYRNFTGTKENADTYAAVCTVDCREGGSGYEGPCRAVIKTICN